MYAPPSADRGSSGPATDAQRNARYAYLVGRIRNRQVTMEEATELFGIMQAMLRASEAARPGPSRAPPPPVPTAAPSALPAPARTAAPPPGDDMFLVGLLAMGAGAGLLAAMARRIAEGPATTSPRASPRTDPSR